MSEVAALYATLGVDDAEFQRKMRAAEGRFESVRRTAVNVVATLATVGAGLGVRELIDYADTWTLIGSRLDLVTDSSEELERVQSRLFAIAQESRTGLEGVADLYVRVARNAEQLGRAQSEILDFTELVNKAIQTSGEAPATAAAGVMQLTQALASGELRGEEFRSVVENLTGVSLVLQRALGKSAGELREMAFAGELTADTVIGAVLSMRQSIESDFSKIEVTVRQGMTVFRNSVLREIGSINQVTGASKAMASAIVGLANNLPMVTDAAQLAAAVIAGKLVVSLTAATSGKVASARQSHALAQAERAQAAASLEAARASEAEAAAQFRSLEATRAAIALSRQQAVATLQRNQAILTSASANVPIENLAPLGHAAVTRELQRRAQAAQAVSGATRELAILGRQQASVDAALARAQLGVAASAGVAEARQNALAAATARASIVARAGAASMTLLRRAMTFLTGPWGIAIASIAAAFVLFRDRTDDASDSMDRARASADRLRGALADLSEQEAEATQVAAQAAVDATKAKLEALKKQRESLTTSPAEIQVRGQLGVPSREELDAIGGATPEVQALDAAIAGLNAQLAGQEGILDATTQALFRYRRGTKEPGDTKEFDRLTQSLREQLVEMQRGERAAFAYALAVNDKLTPAQRAQVLAQFDAVEAARRYNEQQREAQRSASEFTERVADLITELATERVLLLQGEEAARRMELAHQGITGALQDEILARERHNRQLREEREEREKGLRESRRQAEDELREWQRAMEAAQDRLDGISSGMSDSVIDAFAGIITMTRNVADAFRDMVSRILQEVARLALQRGLGQLLDGIFGSVVGAITGGASAAVGPGVSALPTPGSHLPGIGANAQSGVTVHMTVPVTVNSLDPRTAGEVIMGQRHAIGAAAVSAITESTALMAALARG